MLGRTVKAYGFLSAFCGVFSVVYLHFSYGESSPFMVLLFLPPLLLGLVPAEALLLTDRVQAASRPVRALWNSGVAVLTVGFLVRAVINISGRYTHYDILYWVLSAGFFALAAFTLSKRAKRRSPAGGNLPAYR